MDPHATPDTLLRHAGFVRALARRLVGDADDAEDLAQDVCEATLRRAPAHSREMRAWLATVLRRTVKHDARRRRARAERERIVSRSERVPSTAELAEHEDAMRRVTEAVLALDEPYRRTVLQRYYLDRSSAEIARREGVPAGTVRARLSRAVERLRDELDASFGDRGVWSLALLPLAACPRTETLTAGTTLAAGGLAMSTMGKVVGVATAAAALLLVARVWSGTAPAQGEPPEVEAVERDLALPVASTGDATSAASSDPARSSDDSSRLPLVADDLDANTVHVTIVEFDGRPVANRAVLVVGESPPSVAHTDESGRIAFAADGALHSLIIERDASPAHRASVEFRPGAQVLRVPRGEELAGRVTVDGHPPRETFELVLWASKVADKRAVVDDPAELLLDPSRPCTTTTGADGTFRFVGLDVDWCGNVRIEGEGFARAGTLSTSRPSDPVTVHFDRPTTDARIELERFPSIFGRIVRADGSPAVDGHVEAAMSFATGLGYHAGAVVDPDGVFAIYAAQPLRTLSLTCREGRGGGPNEVEFQTADIPADGDLGDLVLAPSFAFDLVVTDTTGRPLEGACIAGMTAKTDARGRVRVEGFNRNSELEVGARGFLPKTIALSKRVEQLTIALEPCNELRIKILSGDGDPEPEIPIELSFAGDLFDSARMWVPSRVWRDYGDGTWHISKNDEFGNHVWGVRADDDGRFSIDGVLPIPIVAVVRSSDGDTLVEQEIAPLEPTEKRDVVLRIDSELRTLVVRVLDEEGAPIPGASVSNRRTDATGRCAVRWLARGSGPISIQKGGYLPIAIEDFRYPPHGSDATFTLVRGRDVRVAVVDGRERPVDPAEVEAYADEGKWRGTAIGPGLYELRGLPDRPVRIEVEVAGALYRYTHAPADPELRVVVPGHGSLEAVWEGDADAPSWNDFLWIEVASATAGVNAKYVNSPNGSHVFPLVLPGPYDVQIKSNGSGEVLARGSVVVEPDRQARVLLEHER